MATAIERANVTIASSGTTSTAAQIPSGKTLIAVVTPAALTGTAFTFEVSDDGGTTYKPVYNEGTQLSVTVGTSRHVALDATATRALVGGSAANPTSVKVVSGSSEAASRTIQLVYGIVN
jgi:hypothetical protein